MQRKTWALLSMLLLLLPPPTVMAQAVTTTEPTSAGEVTITSIAHGTLMLEFGGTVFHVDPWSDAGVAAYPEADWVFITHQHGDHFDPAGIEEVRKDETEVVAPAVVAEEIPRAITLANGESLTADGIRVEAVPAYNEHHPEGVGNGYVFSFGDKRIYIAGDTGCTAEMRQIADVHVAFLPMYAARTMTPEDAAECAKAFSPSVLYAYHYRNDNPRIAEQMLADTDIEFRIGAPSPP